MAGKYSVEGVFRVVDKMTQPLRRMERGLHRFTHEGARGLKSIGAAAKRFKAAITAVAAAVGAAAAAMAIAMKDVIDTGVEFDRSIASAAAKFPGEVRRGTKAFEQLERAALEVGGSTEFMASQAAQGLDFLAMAGFGAEQAVAALPGVVDLATAGQLELARATDIASDSLGAFGLMTKDATQLGVNLQRVNDVIARTATSANTNVEDMFEAIVKGAPVATDAGASIETFSAMVGILAGNGLKASEAGTALKNVFLRLQAPASEGAAALRKLGIDVADKAGNMRDVLDLLGEFETKLRGVAGIERAGLLKDIFGDRAITAMNLLLAAGSKELRDYRSMLEGARGAGAKMASTMRDQAGGDLSSLSSAIESVKLAVWELVRGPFREAIQSLTGWTRANKDVVSGRLQKGLTWLKDHWEGIVTVVRVLAIVFGALYAVIELVVRAVVAYYAAAFFLFGKIGEGLSALWNAVSGAASTMFEAIASAVRAAWSALGAAWQAAQATAASVVAWFASMWAKASDVLTGVMEVLVGLFVLVRNAGAAYFRPIFDAAEHLARWLLQRWQPVGVWLARLFGKVAAAASLAFTAIVNAARSAKAWVAELWGSAARFVGGIWEGVSWAAKSALDTLVRWVALARDAVLEIWSPIADFFTELWNDVASAFQRVFGTVLAAIQSAVAAVRAVGRAELEHGGQSEAPRPKPLLVDPAVRAAYSVRETIARSQSEVTIRDETGRATWTERPPSTAPIKLQSSGAF